MINYKLEWALKVAEKSKFVLKGTKDMTIRIPVEYLHAMGWEAGKECQISSAFWDNHNLCHKIQIELVDKPKRKGRWGRK